MSIKTFSAEDCNFTEKVRIARLQNVPFIPFGRQISHAQMFLHQIDKKQQQHFLFFNEKMSMEGKRKQQQKNTNHSWMK